MHEAQLGVPTNEFRSSKMICKQIDSIGGSELRRESEKKRSKTSKGSDPKPSRLIVRGTDWDAGS